jgi:hypothetical protein
MSTTRSYCTVDGISKFQAEKSDLKIGALFLSPTPTASKKMRNLRAALQSVFPDCYTCVLPGVGGGGRVLCTLTVLQVQRNVGGGR